MVLRKKKNGVNKEGTTMKKNILSLAALLIASATFVACSSDDNIIDEQPAKPQVYTMTVNAQKGGDDATTRALALDGKTLNATWNEGEAVTVYNVTKGAELTGTLTAQSSGASTMLKGSLTGAIDEGDELTLKFLSPSYNTQDGTLTGSATSIDKVCDYATATVTVASVSGGNITTTADASFTNQQAIVKFTLEEKTGGLGSISTWSYLFASNLIVSDGTNSYTVTPASATSEIYVAIPGVSGQTVTLTATVGSDTYTYEKANVTFTNGKYYEITVKMTKQASASYTECPDSNHPHWIDLGLTSGTQWQCCNQGATVPEGYGSYYSVEDAKSYNLPTKDQIEELLNNTTSEWTTLNGVNGRWFTSKNNSGKVFLPAAGYRWGNIVDAGSNGYYLSSTIHEFLSNNAYNLSFNSGSASKSDKAINQEQSVRPVRQN